MGGNPVNYYDPLGLEVYGGSIGGSVTLGHISFGTSITLAVDSQFNFAAVVTPEIGYSTEVLGSSLFARGVVGPDANTTVSDLLGPGGSGSFSAGSLSFSGTFPGNPNKYGVEAPIFEFGLGTPGVNGIFSYGYGVSFSDYFKMLSGFFNDSLPINFRCE